MHVVIILLILFILLYCFAIFPEMSRQKRMKHFMELCSPTEGFTVRLTEFRKIPCQLFAPQFKKITELSWIFI